METKYEQQENRWSLFRNKEKKSDNSPEFSGTININGTIYKLTGWINEYSGGRYFSGTVRPDVDNPDDIPF